MTECKTFTKQELNCSDLVEYSYEFENIGYCPYGDDYNIMKCKVVVIPDKDIPDASFVSAQIRSWRSKCVEESTEGRAQLFMDYFWDLCKPKRLTIEFSSAGSRGTMIHGCKLERKA